MANTIIGVFMLLLILIIALMGYISELLSENCKLKRKIERLKKQL